MVTRSPPAGSAAYPSKAAWNSARQASPRAATSAKSCDRARAMSAANDRIVSRCRLKNDVQWSRPAGSADRSHEQAT